MPDTKISALGEDATPDAVADWMVFVDVSDTSMAASGTTQKVHSNDIRASMVNAASGSVQRSLKDKFGEWVSVKDFGAVGDGTTDNATALIAMRNYCKTLPNTHFHINMPYGHYKYTNNRWLQGIRNFSLHGNGSTLECTANKTFSRDEACLYFHDILEDHGDIDYPGDTPSKYGGYAISTVAAGARSVTATGNGSNFTAGDKVYICGFNQQDGGFPTNLRYGEYHDVVSVASDVISILRPLEYGYKSTWPSVPILSSSATVGPGKILRLNRTNSPWSTIQIYNDVVFALNSVTGEDAFWVLGQYVELNRCVIYPILFAAASRLHCYNDSHFVRGIEIDKNITEVEINRSYTYNVTGATGCRYVKINDSDLIDVTQIMPRNLIARQSRFGNLTSNVGTVRYGTTDLRVEQYKFVDCIFSATSVSPPWHINVDRVVSLTVDAVNGSKIRVEDDAAGRISIRALDVGTVIFLADGTNHGTVTDINYVAGTPNYYELTGTWATPSVSNVFSYRSYGGLEIRSCISLDAIPIGDDIWAPSFPGQTLKSGTITVLPWAVGTVTTNLIGHIVQARIVVTKIYSGADLAPFINLQRNNGSVNSIFLSCPIKTAGDRRIDEFAADTQAGDTATVANLKGWCRSIRMDVRQGGSPISDQADLTKRAVIAVDLQWRPLA